MQRRAPAEIPGYARLLDAWTPPPGAGEALGCFATSFTFNADFFEEECLARMLELETDLSAGALHLIEREEKMARMQCATLIVDQHHARGQRSLRWDLIPFRAEQGILHAKVSLLLWRKHARLIVGSANLTEPGYRNNLEVFTALDYNRESCGPAELFSDAIEFARELLNACVAQNPAKFPALERAREFLSSARARVSDWINVAQASSSQRHSLIASSPARPSVLRQMQEHWKSTSPPNTLCVLSPFFDEDPVSTIKEVGNVLRQRGQAAIRYSVIAEGIPGRDRIRIFAPKGLTIGPNDRTNVSFEAIKTEVLDGRGLHAKALWLENDDQFLHVVGSSNFTAAGLGTGSIKNWELNVATLARRDAKEVYRAHVHAWPKRDADPIDVSDAEWNPEAAVEDEADPSAVLLPNWCGSAIFSTSSGKGVITLHFVAPATGEWEIFAAVAEPSIASSTAWRQQASPPVFEIPWPDSKPPTELLIRLVDKSDFAHWPVEIRSFGDLPPPVELVNLSLEQLLQILTSSLPLHRALQKLARISVGGEGDPVPAIVLDPLRRFATDNHLLARTRRFSLAMAGVRRRLETPIPSEEFLHWRLRGPVGVAKVAAAILKEAAHDGERAFLLGELALELAQIEPKHEAGCVSKKRVKEALAEVAREFEAQALPLLERTDESLQRYVRGALQKARL